MTSDAVPADGDPRRLLADARQLARRVRVARRVTWLPLLVLGLVTLGAIPAFAYGRTVESDCYAVADGQVCKVWFQTASFYWWTALVLGYVLIAAGYLRVARARGLGARVLPYAVVGITLLALFTLFHVVVASHLIPPPDGTEPVPWIVLALFRLTDFTGSIGLALLVLALLERHVALLLFTLAYLVVIVVPINFGWGVGWGDKWEFAPMLAISGGMLLLGSAGFALAQRLRRPR
jgi:hypothetical protein